MPLSEFLKLARGKLQSSQQETYSNETFSRAENGLLELVWENGQVVMQDQSSKVNQSNNNPQNAPSNVPRIRDPGSLHVPNKIGKYGEVETILDDISPVAVPSSDIDLTQDDDMIRWLSCPIDDPLHQDYCSDLIPEISGVTATQGSVLPVDKGMSCFKTFGSNLHDGNSTLKASTSSSKPYFGSGVSSDVITNNPSNHQSVMYNSSSRGKSVIDDPIMRRQNIQYLPTNGTDLMNFSHFSKPMFLAKPNDPTSGTLPNVAPSLPVKKIGFSEQVAYSSGKSTVMEQLKDGVLVNSRQPMAQENAERRENAPCQESCTRTKKQSEASNNSRRDVSDANEKIAEAVVVTSSVGSGNSADRLSYGQTQNSKRKYPDDSECRSDDVETESVGVKKPTNARGGNGSKRSRAAEVHNLSERRRRDRINEKMRALQELIPNCNKADKASMLDEAIEYLKTLQLQVQMMSMGAGLCMPPPMMYPHPTHFPPLMGMGMGYGSHMFPLNSPHFPRISPCSNIPGYGNLGQGIPGLVLPRPPPPPPQPPLVHPMNGGGVPHVTTTTTTTTHLNLSASGQNGMPCSSSPLHNVTEDSVIYKNSQLMCNSEDGGSLKHISSQQVLKERINESTKGVQENEQTADKVHPSNNDNNNLCMSSSTELNKEEAGNKWMEKNDDILLMS